MFDIFRKKSQTLPQLKAAREAIKLDDLRSALATMQADRRTLLLSGSDDQIRALDVKIADASLKLERADAAAAQLDQLIVEAVQKAAEAEFNERYASVVAARDAAMQRIDSEYAKGAHLILAVIAAVEAANRAVQEINRELDGKDLPLIDDADVLYWRGRYSHPETRIIRTALLPTHNSPPYGRPADGLFDDAGGAWAK